MHPLQSRPGPGTRSGNTEIVGSGSSASGPRPQAKASVRWMGLRRARPSSPTPWSNVGRREGGFFLLCPCVKAKVEADEECTLGVVSGEAARRRTSLLEREERVKEAIHVWAMFVRLGEGQIDEAPESRGPDAAPTEQARRELLLFLFLCADALRVSCPTVAY